MSVTPSSLMLLLLLSMSQADAMSARALRPRVCFKCSADNMLRSRVHVTMTTSDP